MAGLSKLDTLRPFEKGRRKRRVFRNMLEEELPASAITVADWLDIGHLLPLIGEDHGLGVLRVEERFGCGDQRLHKAAVEAANAVSSTSTSYSSRSSSRRLGSAVMWRHDTALISHSSRSKM